MEIFIIIILAIIGLELYLVLGKMHRIGDLLQRIWEGLFNTPRGGLGRLDYLEYIHTELEKMIKSQEKKDLNK